MSAGRLAPPGGEGWAVEAELTATVESLSRQVERQAATISALVLAAERRLDRPAADSAFARWEQNIALHQLVEDRTARIRTAERLLRTVIDSVEDTLCILDGDGRILGTNRVWNETTGDAAAGASGAGAGAGFLAALPALGFTAQDADRIGEAVRGVLAGTLPDASLRASLLRDGVTQHVVVRVHQAQGHGEAAAVVSIVDVTVTMQAQQQAAALAQALAVEKSILAGILASIPLLVYWKDAGLRYVGVNQAFLAARGLTDEREVLDRTEDELPVQDAMSEQMLAVEGRVLASGEACSDLYVRVIRPDGTRRDLMLSVLPRADQAGGHEDRSGGVIGVGADVTQLRQLERQLAQASRLESIGQLASGVAHEINTPVQYVSDNTAFVAQAAQELLDAVQVLAEMVTALDEYSAQDGSLPAEPGTRYQDILRRARETLERVELDSLAEEIPSALAQSLEGLHRVAEIVRAMKEFAHPGSSSRRADVNRAIETTVQVCRNEWKYVAQVELDLDPELPQVACYEGELKQTLLNIIVNAAQAIAGAGTGSAPGSLPGSGVRGRIRVSTEHDAQAARIIISDNGPGMDQVTQQRIFDPFFTTKEVGRGSGQGLSIAYTSIVTKHHGQLMVVSAPGQGATFTISLPLTPPPDRGAHSGKAG